MSGAAYAACVENARLSRMNGYASQRSDQAIALTMIQATTIRDWPMM
jgi:hypothetical protein